MASGPDLSGNYLITVTGHPNSVNGTSFCASIVEQAKSTLDFPVSGTVTLDFGTGGMMSGHWFSKSRSATFEVQSGTDFIVFSGDFGAPQITNTTFISVANGKPVIGGTFTAKKNGC